MNRVGDYNHFLRAGRLLQEFLCMMFSKAEQQRYNWLEMNQRQLRMDLYTNVVDHVGQSDVRIQDIGRKVILPATHIGSPRDMQARFQVTMAVVREKEKADLFITGTCVVRKCKGMSCLRMNIPLHFFV